MIKLRREVIAEEWVMNQQPKKQNVKEEQKPPLTRTQKGGCSEEGLKKI